MLNETYLFLPLVVSGAYFFWKRIHQYLRFLQQEEYDPRRFLNWVLQNKFFDCKAAMAIIGSLPLAVPSFIISAFHVLPVFFIYVGWSEPDPRTAGKIKLKLTERAKRIRNLAFALQILTFLALVSYLIAMIRYQNGYYLHFYIFWILLTIIIQITPIFLAFAVQILQPSEDRIQKKLLDQAKHKFREINPYTIGITGSFGKTSSKAMLGKMLDSALAPTFWPEKGINTPMGITREIREKLSADHKFAVIEMGAYRPGSIKRLCDLTPPRAAIITAVGRMHLDRMGGDDGVFKAKSELPQALPEDGILVCNADNEGARKIASTYPKQTTILCSLTGEIELLPNEELCVLQKLETKVEGTKFKIKFRNAEHQGFLAMHGTPALSNFNCCFALASALGADPEYLLAVARNLKQVSNRLEVVTSPEYSQINDAYNSNPQGFVAALEVLRDLPGKRKILVTPGMVELGDKQVEENKKVAEFAAKVCDQVYIVSEENRKTLHAGLQAGSFPDENIVFAKNRERAFELLGADRQSGDVVLLENDLPDLFELDVKL